MRTFLGIPLLIVLWPCYAADATAQTTAAGAAVQGTPANPAVAPGGANTVAGITPPSGYVVGPDDQLIINFWRDKDMSAEVIVRPDGKITLPLLNDIQAAGLTPDELRSIIIKAATKFVEDPNVTVTVKQILSRKVFITGQVAKPGPYLLNSPMTVLQLIAVAGGVLEFADTKNVGVLRTENGKPVRLRVNYDDLAKGKNLNQNIELKPGDQVLVP